MSRPPIGTSEACPTSFHNKCRAGEIAGRQQGDRASEKLNSNASARSGRGPMCVHRDPGAWRQQDLAGNSVCCNWKRSGEPCQQVLRDHGICLKHEALVVCWLRRCGPAASFIGFLGCVRLQPDEGGSTVSMGALQVHVCMRMHQTGLAWLRTSAASG